MDWTKAKNILIVALVITNFVLIFAYVQGNMEKEPDNREGVLSYLEKKDIYLETEIATGDKKMAVVEVKNGATNTRQVAKAIKESKGLEEGDINKETIKKMTDEFLIKGKFMNETVQLKEIVPFEDGIKVEYKTQIDDVLVEESYMRFIIKSGKIESFERHWLEVIELGKTKQTVISVEDALLDFAKGNPMETRDEKEIYIKDMQLVYWLDNNAFQGETLTADTALPAWKITYNQGKVQYVPAYE